MVEPDEDPIALEVSEVLTEWGTILLKLYEERKERRFNRIKDVILELITHRRQILSGTLPHDKLKDLKSRVTAKIDWGNRELGLDFIPRNEYGEASPLLSKYRLA